MANEHKNELISQFCDITGVSAQRATEYLTGNAWNIDSAITSFYADQEDDQLDPSADPISQAPPQSEPEYTGPRTLDGRPAPEYARVAQSAGKKPQKKGLATFASLSSGRPDDDESDDDNADDSRGDLFAGGEKSGLAVQDPNQDGTSNTRKLINDIVAQAKANAKRSTVEAEKPAKAWSRFHGAGQTLGGDGVESRTIPNPHAGVGSSADNDDEPPQERVLHVWHNGFSIDDGDLHRFDDPQNAMVLDMIRQGRAPLHLMNVAPHQRVDVRLEEHHENYRALPKVYRPFSGAGHRLGSPVPGATTSSGAAPTAAAAATPSQPPIVPEVKVDDSQPTIMIRIQLPDGTRIPARFNTTHTVDDLYGLVQRASPEMLTRNWIVATTFPNKDHTDRSLILGDMPEFKKGGTAVVKWV